MAVALLAMQANDFDAAETQLKRVLELNYKDPDLARFYLGQLNEERKRFDEALKWYATVGQGEQYIPAQSRYAGILAKQGKLPEARRHLQEAGAQQPPAARAIDAGGGAAPARRERLPGSVRCARPGAREDARLPGPPLRPRDGGGEGESPGRAWRPTSGS